MSWVRFPVTAGLFTFLYFCLITSLFNPVPTRESQSSLMWVALQKTKFITSLSAAVANTLFVEVIPLSHLSLSPEGVTVGHLPPSAAAMSSRAQ